MEAAFVTSSLLASAFYLQRSLRNEKESLRVLDAAIVCAGGILPTAALQKMGIVVETKYGTV